MFTTLTTIAWFLIAICILVGVHEYGHFVAARLAGVKVLRFSIGFGSRLFTWKDKHGTEFAFSAIPLGGYVKMLDEKEGDVAPEDLPHSFQRQSPIKRIGIAAAGPAINFLLAFVLYWVLTFVHGTMGLAPIVGDVTVGSLADRAGLESGQKIIAVDGEETPTQRSVLFALIGRLGESGELNLTVKYPDSDMIYVSPVTLDNWLRDAEEPDPIADFGFNFWSAQPDEVYIASLTKNSPAELAGLQEGDQVIAVNGEKPSSVTDFVERIQAANGSELAIVIDRQGRELSVPVRPVSAEHSVDGLNPGQIGAAISNTPPDFITLEKYGVFEAFGAGARETWDTTSFVLLSMKKLILGEISTKNLSGPIGIAKVAGDSGRAGMWSFVSFLAMISISLGVINLLPIPVFDGGQILYSFIEMVKGSPLPERIQMVGYQVGLLVVFCMIILASYNDILRL